MNEQRPNPRRRNHGATKMWISRYALTQGIYERAGEVRNGYFCHRAGGAASFGVLMKVGTDAHATKEAAIAAAEAMRAKKLRSMEKQMHKLRDLEF